ncbi:MAG: TetR/AcrR family transcriptional regulator, partial [Pygmaiobacter sp.]
MPKDLFHSLPQKKQDAILSAALREFSVHEYHAASINQIIKFADISRGSFYLYFDDKEDLYLFLLERSLQLRLDAFAAQQKSASYCNIFVFH